MDKQQAFNTFVNQILTAKKKDPNADTSALEKQIDEMVWAGQRAGTEALPLQGLTPEEIAIVEGKAGNNLNEIT